MTTRAHQIAKDNALVAPENRLEIGKYNMQIDPNMKRPKEKTYQVVLDALAITTCHEAFLIIAEVPIIYRHQFWDTVHKRGSLYRFKIDNQKLAIDLRVFREIISICPRIEGQSFTDPPFKEEVLAFVRHLGHTGEIKYIIDITVGHLHQLWRAFAAIINKCLSGKVSGLDKMHLSRIQILWGHIDNKDAKKTDKMYYPIFTKASISHYIKQNPSISLRNKMFMHTARDDTILGILKFVSKNEDVQVYGALIPKAMTNQEMLSSESFQTYYAIATGAAPPKSKKQRKAGSSKSSEQTLTRKSPRIKRSAKVSSAKSKKKAPAKADTSKNVYISQASGLGAGTNEGTGTIPGVPDVPKVNTKSEAESWGDSDDEDDVDADKSDNESDDDNDGNNDDDDDDGDENDNEGNDTADDEYEEEEKENVDDIDFSDSEDDKEKDEEEEDDYKLLYRDVNVNLHVDVDMTNAE
ncbi:hypothetical protein Tco_1085973 [Tanacetum coccineum]